mgnify:CR=1 FL=1
MKLPLKIWLIIISILVILIILIGTLLLSKFESKEITKIINPNLKEKIFLIHTAWGSHDKIAIGLNRELRGGDGFIYPEKFNSDCADPFFYKLSEDTLFIISFPGRFNQPEINQFRTYVNIIDNFTSYDSLCINSNYKTLGYKVFPESMTYVIENRSKQ